jgi:hypothetical protein
MSLSDAAKKKIYEGMLAGYYICDRGCFKKYSSKIAL